MALSFAGRFKEQARRSIAVPSPIGWERVRVREDLQIDFQIVDAAA